MKRMQGVVAVAVLSAMALPIGTAQALSVRRVDNAATLKECGACHMVYAPQMLPQRSWQALMSGLADHFGESAVLEDATRLEVLNYLVANAADAPEQKGYLGLLRGVNADAVPLRITLMPWFGGTHGEASFGRRKASNCIACHAGADKSGVFNEPGDSD
jgi:Dihaem cytochrome c